MVLRNAPLDQVADHHVGIDVGYAAVRVADDHDLLHAQLDDAHQQAAHGAVEGAGDHAAGVFDQLHIAVADAQCCGEQLHQTGVHAGEDGDFLVWELTGLELFIALGPDEFAVICQHFFDHGGSPFRIFSIISDFSVLRNRNLSEIAAWQMAY